MRKLYKSLISCLCLTAVLTAGSMKTAGAATETQVGPIRIHGTITKQENQSLVLDNKSGISYPGEMVIQVSEDTKILDAVSGFPVSFDQLKDGETVYAYIGEAMTMSLPPITNSNLILSNVPADFKVPEFLESDELAINSDGVSGSVKATSGTTFTIPADCEITPYLTRNIVRIQDLAKGSTFLLWADGQNRATKIMVFPQDVTEDDSAVKNGWTKADNNWYYYDHEGNMVTGWLKDSDNWYYLNPADGVMHTGFLTQEGKTYYFQEDGKMLTKAKTFTPDASGVLH